MAHPYDDYEGLPGEEERDRERRRRREGWGHAREGHPDERAYGPYEGRGATYGGRERYGERYSGEPEWRPGPWSRERAWESEQGRRDEGSWRERYSRAPRERDPRAARDVMEGGDRGWHGGVRGAEGGGGYGGFFGTAYGLYAGRPERDTSRREYHDTDWRGPERRQGRGPKGYRRSDDRIRDEVCERIARSGVNADDVEVSVESGEVTLSGTVERREDKWYLESIADDVFGVEDVHNQLRTAGRAGRESSDPATH